MGLTRFHLGRIKRWRLQFSLRFLVLFAPVAAMGAVLGWKIIEKNIERYRKEDVVHDCPMAKVRRRDGFSPNAPSVPDFWPSDLSAPGFSPVAPSAPEFSPLAPSVPEDSIEHEPALKP